MVKRITVSPTLGTFEVSGDNAATLAGQIAPLMTSTFSAGRFGRGGAFVVLVTPHNLAEDCERLRSLG